MNLKRKYSLQKLFCWLLNTHKEFSSLFCPTQPVFNLNFFAIFFSFCSSLQSHCAFTLRNSSQLFFSFAFFTFRLLQFVSHFHVLFSGPSFCSSPRTLWGYQLKFLFFAFFSFSHLKYDICTGLSSRSFASFFNFFHGHFHFKLFASSVTRGISILCLTAYTLQRQKELLPLRL